MKNMKSDDQIREDWYAFSNRAFIEWRGDTRKTLTDFADWVGISQSLMSREMQKGGAVPRDQKTITAWVSRYGSKVYEVLGLPEPDNGSDRLPEPLKSISREVRETLAEYTASGNADPPDTGAILDEIMKKYGYILSSTED